MLSSYLQISLGAIVDARDSQQLTPLSLAARSRYERIVHVLLEAGADINGMGC
jgi:ankyrin repeat protein